MGQHIVRAERGERQQRGDSSEHHLRSGIQEYPESVC